MITAETTTAQVRSALRRALPKNERPGLVLRAMGRLERASVLDAVAGPLRRGVQALPLSRTTRDALHGKWLGHPVHPVMVQVPVGAWLSSAVLDLVPGAKVPSRVLIAVGLAGAGPAALTGWVDWADTHKEQLRVGLVHAVLNQAGVVCYAGSLGARLIGREKTGRLLALAGLTAIGAGGAIGGHLAFRQASGANHTESFPHLVSPGWHSLGELATVPLGRPERRMIEDLAVLVVRDADDTLSVIADHCSHLGGPLSEGTISDGCVTCPWHGSVFRLSDGWNVEGPATAPQPAFDVRVTDGEVEVRLRRGTPRRSRLALTRNR
ncbi:MULTISPECIES: Rieske 2Fe-2S domain-containing protein [Streptomyces]|uniref:(2Fe-2S)-binding protein n=1 Tax=Streptomyces wadayamensis TaxID=141454 RepID=A0ABR4SDB5_9ACTN|nr:MULTISPECIES: Rieske (2Fe-2S) protein [Streptomyces]KDR63663.1 (2Fe-2S)-binding protein [Streptomyces wadayamensis]QXQ23514.1 Rieske (2Fe-2S) protein [Streptomyces albidoflavus]QXQ29440.1 Rieske (2Fe-2S) protein [Streptomyces albidoflavus]UKL04583.1 Rieske (2Fe-2S) protein [Streptomyces sp. NBU3104]WTB66500.1 Rieske (2Fe-2S) protein [Streptomyces albidoflavus]